MRTAIVMGGGVAGMTVAHELAERGFAVTVFERRGDTCGGKARTQWVPGSARGGRLPLPGEHGYRYFPGFYAHLDETMARTPFAGNTNGVLDNLVSSSEGLFASSLGAAFVTIARFPRSLAELLAALRLSRTAPDELRKLGLTDDDFRFIAERLLQALTSCRERRDAEYGRLSWWDFVGADQRSDAYKQLLATGLTRNFVATRAETANARTIADVALRIVLDTITPGATSDRVLNGPTNQVWLDPWLRHLRRLGVRYMMGATTTRIHFDGQRVTGVTINDRGSPVTADYYVCAVPIEVAARLVPAEMKLKDPGLAGLSELEDDTEWMNGIQFYLEEPLEIVRGHINCLGSQWALTAICQQQFWRVPAERYGAGNVRSVLSVDISDWESPGDPNGPSGGAPARACAPDLIAQEVWHQLGRALNLRRPVLPATYYDYWLDDDIQRAGGCNSPDIAQFSKPRCENVNLEPLLINRPGTWHLRPEAWTRIPNFHLAADYVRTHTDFASMEAANEAARRAANAILESAGATGVSGLCAVRDPYEPDVLRPLRARDHERWRRGLPWSPLTATPGDAVIEVRGRIHRAKGRAGRLLQALHPFEVLRRIRGLIPGPARDADQGAAGESPDAILSANAQRLPDRYRPWTLHQVWRDLLFTHFPVELESLRRIVPASLALDLFDGKPWASVVAFEVADLDVIVDASIKGAEGFAQLNLRTYVTYNGRPGVFFIRVHTSSKLASTAARTLFSIPAESSRMGLERPSPGSVRFTSNGNGKPSHHFDVSYRPDGPGAPAAAGSLDAFLSERYTTFIVNDDRVLEGEILHDPWSIAPAAATYTANDVLQMEGLQPAGEAVARYANRMSALIWDMREAS